MVDLIGWYPNELSCEECGWIVRECNANQCLNKECSKRNKAKIVQWDYYDKHGVLPGDQEDAGI